MKPISFRSPRNPGFTLIEVMIVVVIVAVLAALAAPSFSDFMEKNRVKGATEEIYGLILQAKSEVPIRDASIFVNTNTAATPWCVGYAAAANCDCTDPSSCAVNVAGTDVTQIVNGQEYPGVTIQETFAGTGTAFRTPRGMVNPGEVGTVSVVSTDWQLDIVVSTTGRIRVCNPNDNAMTGYEPC